MQLTLRMSPPLAALREWQRLARQADRIDAANRRADPALIRKANNLRRQAEAVLNESRRIGRW